MSNSLTIYIDESGDEGFQFGFGSSRWFVLAATVYEFEYLQELSELVERVKPSFMLIPMYSDASHS